MNQTEHKMLNLLKKGKEDFGIIATKAEFETEGTRMDELLRLIEIVHKAEVQLALKIGGCGAIRDLFTAKQLGVDFIIAPMIESSYALSKYCEATHKVFSEDDQKSVQFLFNLETRQAYLNRYEILNEAQKLRADGVVFGRMDYALSLGKRRACVEDEDILKQVCEVATLCKEKALDFVVGGGISIDSLPNLNRIKEVMLSRFETRKIIFDASALQQKNIAEGLVNAIQFELLWLMSKQDYYSAIHQEDEERINLLKGYLSLI